MVHQNRSVTLSSPISHLCENYLPLPISHLCEFHICAYINFNGDISLHACNVMQAMLSCIFNLCDVHAHSYNLYGAQGLLQGGLPSKQVGFRG